MNEPSSTNASEQAGAQIGRYKLLEPIGEGGFGSVWMAEQREPVKRRVALKIIKLGMDTRQVIARFEAERQALAMMDHPHIAKVFDAGTTETGRPYFVMELVKGIPILEYCDKGRLDTKGRLELFASVCHAIQHAHQKGIIHRDIKPSNVLVTLHDGVAVPKVIDFGIAKATNSELTAKTLFTEHQQMIGTPAYMSPEQAQLSGLDIDTRSDIYSLGVLLYELLTGTTPFDIRELLSKGLAEMMRVIREVEPHKPSTRISSLGDTAAKTARERHVDVKKLGATLRGDLDWIVMKCLEKDRSRRYETANGLAADIQRHLHDEPVTAGAPSAAYRLRKFVRRHRGQVIAGGVAAVALVLGVVGTTTGMLRALAEARRAEEAKDEEAQARGRAETIGEFMTEFLGAGDAQNRGGGQGMTILAAMDRAIGDIEAGRFADDPETEAGLKGTIATILTNNGRAAEAEPLAVQALETTRRLHSGDHRDVASSLSRLAAVRTELGRFADAEPVAVQALQMRQRLFEGDHPDVATSLYQLGAVVESSGRWAEAEVLAVQALEMRQRLFKGDHPAVAESLNALAVVRDYLGRTTEAEPLYVQALRMRQRLFKGDHPVVAQSLNNLAWVYMPPGRFTEAESLWVQALEMYQRLFAGDHPDIAASLINLGGVRLELGRAAEAEPLFVRALAMTRRLSTGDDLREAGIVCGLARSHQALGRTAEARQEFDESIALLRRLAPEGSPFLARVLWRSGSAHLENDDTAAALPELEEAVAMTEKLLPPEHPQVKEHRATLDKCRTVWTERPRPATNESKR